MAKKKTVENIKAAPVLRAQSIDQPTPTPEQTGTRTYQIMDPWKDRGVTNLVDVKSVDGEITDVKVNGGPAGGGGTDLGYATMTISDPNQDGVTLVGMFTNPSLNNITGTHYTNEAPVLYPALFGGSGVIYYGNDVEPTLSGNATSVFTSTLNGYFIFITGDFSLTV